MLTPSLITSTGKPCLALNASTANATRMMATPNRARKDRDLEEGHGAHNPNCMHAKHQPHRHTGTQARRHTSMQR